jgi:hypothetical protein
MNRRPLTAAVCLAALALTACNDRDKLAANTRICADFKAASATQTAAPAAPAMPVADAAAPVEDCVRKWAYSLAPSTDAADVVSEAVVAACGSALSRWNQQSLMQQTAGAAAGPEQAISITTGQPTNPMAEHNNFAHARALFYVVQARAGRCAAPPVTNGAPTGLQG